MGSVADASGAVTIPAASANIRRPAKNKFRFMFPSFCFKIFSNKQPKKVKRTLDAYDDKGFKSKRQGESKDCPRLNQI
jgi:hypothetical protein